METLEINQFTLFYDGLFRVEFDHQNKHYDKMIFLEPQTLFKILQNEGLIEQMESLDFHYDEGVQISKTTLSFPMFEKNKISFITSEYGADYQENEIMIIECDFIFNYNHYR